MLLILFSISLCFSWVSPDTNSLTVIYTVISGIEDFPEITNAAMVNGVQIGHYDSDVRRCIPRQQFMAEYFNVKHWDYVSNLISSHSHLAKENLNEILKMTNQTSGIHVLQWIRSVEVTEDGSIKRSMRVGFDGKDYISLEPDRMRWVASNHIAVKTKEKWDSDETWNNYWESHLQQVYVQRLKQYLQAGKEYFKRKVQPEVFISRSDPNNQYKPLTLSCLVTGFYPVDIEVSWLRNGEVMSETLSSGVRPNHDGTHQIQKEIEINVEDEDQYSCQIEHSSLAETQLCQWEIPEKSGQLLHPGIVTGLVIVGICTFGIIAIYICKRQQRDSPSVTYTTAQRHSQSLIDE
ncbi:class I histocompatibility antigen, F10 alpha chain-like isoform X2 [Carcharodon carcharias]|uniref:class I histocompatibility antigen, F10 alpha chain-like isoform X2 n=1 Tax=Carcharodon carcharias TaxID=13397 RepID=UPI001B7E0135|nr:class I histocompatibility antigen, F10 alpha chain-like isoform X2 [Carcharodon carcharias]